MATNTTPLPSREAGLYKRMIKLYEQKQYKNGLKLCKQILSGPGLANHADTLAMKALILSAQDKKTEAFDTAKLALRYGIRSSMCWHVMGLIYRADRNYLEAGKCYRQALRLEKGNTNVQILRDLSQLQIQMRDYSGFTSTRHELLNIRPEQRASWFGYAIAEHLNGNFARAAEIMTAFEKTQSESDANYEGSEIVLYHATILFEGGLYQECLTYLQANDAKIVDREALKELLGDIHTAMGNLSEAQTLFRQLFSSHDENRDYLSKLEIAAGLNDQSPESAWTEFYSPLRSAHPKSYLLQRVPLDHATGANFESLADGFLRKLLTKGVVPLFRLLRTLYGNADKVAILEKLLTGYLTSLKSCLKFDPKDASEVYPSVLVWTYFTLAQHYDHVKQHDKALALIDESLQHTPTWIESYMAKAKILKHLGRLTEAAAALDTGRELDTADRFINCKAVKYFLRATNVERAEELAGMFTRSENTDPIGQLTEMQCIWFEYEEALAFANKGQLGKALKKLHTIDTQYNTFIDDQFDFHTYCFRKVTLRAYIRLVRFEDHLQEHKSFVRAALAAIKIYIGLHDKPFSLTADGKKDDALDGLDESERKKQANKARKAAKVAEAKAAAQAAATDKEKDKEDQDEKKDLDPDGLALAQTKTPLEDALKFLRPLQTHAKNDINVQLVAYDLYSRKKKPMLILQSIIRAAAIDPNHPRVIEASKEFIALAKAECKTWQSKVVQVALEEVAACPVFKGVDVAAVFAL